MSGSLSGSLSVQGGSEFTGSHISIRCVAAPNGLAMLKIAQRASGPRYHAWPRRKSLVCYIKWVKSPSPTKILAISHHAKYVNFFMCCGEIATTPQPRQQTLSSGHLAQYWGSCQRSRAPLAAARPTWHLFGVVKWR